VSLLLALGVAGATELPTSVLPWRKTPSKTESRVPARTSQERA
jgi:hypothetical protein